MNCPICNKTLQVVKQQDQGLQLCLKCGGIWLEDDQLSKAVSKLASNKKIHYRTVKKCPRCNIDLSTFKTTYDSHRSLDKCPFCRGLWLKQADLVKVAQQLENSSQAEGLLRADEQFLKRQLNKRKYIATAIAVAYLLLAFKFGEPGAWLRLALFLIFPIAGIFYGQKLDSLNFKLSLGKWVVIGGWVMLFLPLIFALGKMVFG